MAEFEVVSVDRTWMCVKDAVNGREFGFRIHRHEDGTRTLIAQADAGPIGDRARIFVEGELLRDGRIDRRITTPRPRIRPAEA
jgi:hypothetical protein